MEQKEDKKRKSLKRRFLDFVQKYIIDWPIIGKYAEACLRVGCNDFDPGDQDRYDFDDSGGTTPGFKEVYSKGNVVVRNMPLVIREAEMNMENVLDEHSDVNTRANYYLVLDGVSLAFIYSLEIGGYSLIPGLLVLLSICILLFVISHGSMFKKVWRYRKDNTKGKSKKEWRLTHHVNFDIRDP